MRRAIHIFYIHTLDYIEFIPPSDTFLMMHWAQLVPLRSCGSASKNETGCLPGQLYSPVLPHSLLLLHPNHVLLYTSLWHYENTNKLAAAVGNYAITYKRPVYLKKKALD